MLIIDFNWRLYNFPPGIEITTDSNESFFIKIFFGKLLYINYIISILKFLLSKNLTDNQIAINLYVCQYDIFKDNIQNLYSGILRYSEEIDQYYPEFNYKNKYLSIILKHLNFL